MSTFKAKQSESAGRQDQVQTDGGRDMSTAEKERIVDDHSCGKGRGNRSRTEPMRTESHEKANWSFLAQKLT